MNKLLLVALLAGTAGCSESGSSRYNSGYRDGYAVGYNTTCKIRATKIKRDWDDKEYSEGYIDGQVNGVLDCKNKKD